MVPYTGGVLGVHDEYFLCESCGSHRFYFLILAMMCMTTTQIFLCWPKSNSQKMLPGRFCRSRHDDETTPNHTHDIVHHTHTPRMSRKILLLLHYCRCCFCCLRLILLLHLPTYII